jgi:hypothetical protein
MHNTEMKSKYQVKKYHIDKKFKDL